MSALVRDGVTEKVVSMRLRPSAVWSVYVVLTARGDTGRRAAIVVNDGNGFRVACVDRDGQACQRRFGG